MDLNWLQSVLIGLVSGLTDILPVSAQAHKVILLKLFGHSSEPIVLRFMIHLATLAGLYYCCQNQIVRISRQLRLSRIPKKRRKRPLDTRTLMDFKLLRMMMIPTILGFFAYQKTSVWNHSLNWIALMVLVNAVILYLPVLMPSGNKDSRSMSGMDSLVVGLGGALSVIPGFSRVGVMVSAARMRGTDKRFAVEIALLLCIPMLLGLCLLDFFSMISAPATAGFLLCLTASVAAFGGSYFGVQVVRFFGRKPGFTAFAYYSWGAALLALILYLTII